MGKMNFSRQRLRKSFGSISQAAQLPDLIEMQKASYGHFLDTGLRHAFDSVFPITDYSGQVELRFVDYEFDEPKYDITECRRRGVSYAAQLKVTLELVVYQIDPETGAKKIEETVTKRSTVHMGEMPIMTNEGTFIVNGATRVVVSQMHRSPGVFFSHDKGRNHPSGKLLYDARIIPYRGSWVDFEFDTKDLIYVRIDRKRKILASTFLMSIPKEKRAGKGQALSYWTKAELLRQFYKNIEWTKKDDGWQAPYDPERFAGVRLTYDVVDARTGDVIIEKGKRLSERRARKIEARHVLVPKEALYGAYLASEQSITPSFVGSVEETKEKLISIVLPQTDTSASDGTIQDGQGASSSEEGDKGRLLLEKIVHVLAEDMVKHHKKKEERYTISASALCDLAKESGKQPHDMCARVMYGLATLLEGKVTADGSDESTLTITYALGYYLDTGHELSPKNVDDLFEKGRVIHAFDIDHVRVGPWVRNTFYADKNTNHQEALLSLYQIMRPGEQATEEDVEVMLEQMLFSPERYDLSEVGRFKMNKRLGIDCPDTERTLRPEDISKIISVLAALRDGRGDVDDIDHLANRRLRCVGELLENQYRQGLLRMQRAIRERMGSMDSQRATAMNLMNAKPVVSAMREFFGSSSLSQFMEQTNPLSELTHKRRISALGAGGLTRESAGFEVRDVHPSHYGRICPVETPEGPNIGLINSLSTYARVNKHGFIETPYRKVHDRRVSRDIVYLSAMEEAPCTIAQSNATMDEKDCLTGDLITCRQGGEVVMCSPQEVDYMDVSPRQLVSVAAALIPFLENDDAKRILMGSNTQRQAVPLLVSEAPFVGTGMEYVIGKDSSATVLARCDGIVDQVDAKRIVTRAMGESESSSLGVDIYNLNIFQRSNNNTCIHQRPLVRRGEKISKGDIIADGPCTDKGELALGRNVLAAFMPWKGYNFEDSVLISNRIVRDDIFTSIHIEEFKVEARDTKLGPDEITRDIPNISEDAISHLDEVGIVHVGAEVHPGDILVGKVTPKGEIPLTPEEKLLRHVFGEKVESMRDTSLRLPPGAWGTVIEVRVFSRKGVDKGERLVANEADEIKRLTQEHNDVRSILERGYRQRMRDILRGQKLRKALGSLKKGTILDDSMFDSLSYAEFQHIEVVSDDATDNIEVVRRDLREKIERSERHFESKKEAVYAGDDLPPGVLESVKVFVAVKRKIQVGDKVAGRHGNKGVISKIMPMEDMPYMEDGTPVDIVLNPLGVPSRMNVGQILETHLGWASVGLGKTVRQIIDSYQQLSGKDEKARSLSPLKTLLGKVYGEDVLKEAGITKDNDMIELGGTLKNGVPFATPIFDGADENHIINMLALGDLDKSGQVTLIDGQTGEPFARPVTVGYIYMMKLHHLVDDKIHARATGPYSLVTQQPLGGKAQLGGQRFGEMEVWALEAYGAAHTLREMLTIKSDDVEGRTKAYETIVQGSSNFDAGTPESFNVLVKELRSLALNIRLTGNSLDIPESHTEGATGHEEHEGQSRQVASIPETDGQGDEQESVPILAASIEEQEKEQDGRHTGDKVKESAEVGNIKSDIKSDMEA